MKNTFMKSTSWKQTNETGALASALSAGDGRTIAGRAGNLRIAFQPLSLGVPFHTTTPTHWLLPLNDVEMVRLSANLPGDLLWLSPRRPEAVVGLLLGDFRGAWWQGPLAVLQLHGETEAYILPSSHPAIGSLSTLAGIVACRWAGQSQAQVHSALLLASGVNGAAAQSSTTTPQLAVA